VFKLLKGGECYSPERIGKKDVLIFNGTICGIENEICEDRLWKVEIHDCRGMILCPGFIDQHVHITGGGGEEGAPSRIPGVLLGDILSAGVTTLVGVLGLDDMTRNIAALCAKAKALESEGITSYIYTGSYGVPTATLTGKVASDLAFIDKVIGTGEIAISDHRSAHPSVDELKKLAWETHTGGMVGGKAGIVHIHVGDGKKGLGPLLELLEQSDFPVDMFVPTHLNRNRLLFEQALSYAGSGGNIDLTAGETSGKGYGIPEALGMISKSGVEMDRVTVSSDGNGSIPAGKGNAPGVGKVWQLFEDIRDSILNGNIPIELALKTVTANVARRLGLTPVKGILSEGSDADILVLDRETLNIVRIFAKGQLMANNGEIIKKGRFEKGNG